MRWYVTADPHGFYTLLREALERAGYFDDPAPHRLVVLGDLMDRGAEAAEMQDFILRLLEENAVILVRGNHEDLFEQMVTVDGGRALSHHRSNGTFDTGLQLTGVSPDAARRNRGAFAALARRTPYYRTILPAMRDYFETAHYVFVHGWIPCVREGGVYAPVDDWRGADCFAWERARWINGMDAARTAPEPEKTVLCGHWHASYGHAVYERKCSEFGPDADFSPYRGPGVIALDACTAYSGQVNVLVLEDEEAG